ncbi:MAG: cell wall-active antibiotics response protein [Tannerellaceae bacterium]|jgi:predicted membrane protein|nr:cell wall-active antibiotics response protein [Tannerellaceae bacterium]
MKQKGHTHLWHYRLSVIATSLALIATGTLFMAHNFGYIDDCLFRSLVSWKTLLVVLGLINLVKRRFFWGVFFILGGGYFMIPPELGARHFWPLLLIIGGLLLLFRLRHPFASPLVSMHKRCHRRFFRNYGGAIPRETSTVEDGYVRSDVTFGAARHIVLDPVFKGAQLDVSFGNIVLDLVRTQLEEEETFIHVDNSFGGVELFVPSSWNVIIEVESIFGSCIDRRFRSPEVDASHKLIIRGEVSFGGLEIKS